MHNPVFIWPFSRSGGTLLTTILNTHSKISMSYEIYEADLRLFGSDFITPDQAVKTLVESADRAGITLMRNQPNNIEPKADLTKDEYRKWTLSVPKSSFRSFVARAHRGGIGPDQLLRLLGEYSTQNKSFVEIDGRLDFIDDLMKTKMLVDRKSIWGGKAKVGLNHLSRRHSDAAVFMMVRDGRDVLASRLRVGSFDTDPVNMANEWSKAIAEFEDFKKEHTGLAAIVKYEELVLRPKAIVAKICNEIGVEFETMMLSYEKARQTLFENPYGHLSLNQLKQGLNKESLDRWKREVDSQSINQFEMAAGKTLVRWGYHLSEPANQ